MIKFRSNIEKQIREYAEKSGYTLNAYIERALNTQMIADYLNPNFHWENGKPKE